MAIFSATAICYGCGQLFLICLSSWLNYVNLAIVYTSWGELFGRKWIQSISSFFAGMKGLAWRRYLLTRWGEAGQQTERLWSLNRTLLTTSGPNTACYEAVQVASTVWTRNLVEGRFDEWAVAFLPTIKWDPHTAKMDQREVKQLVNASCNDVLFIIGGRREARPEAESIPYWLTSWQEWSEWVNFLVDQNFASRNIQLNIGVYFTVLAFSVYVCVWQRGSHCSEYFRQFKPCW